MGVLEISQKHGQEMYALGLEHAIEMFKLAGADILPQLQIKLDECRKEIENE